MKKIVLFLLFTVLLTACLPSQDVAQRTVDAALNPHYPTAADFPSITPLPTDTPRSLVYLPPDVTLATLDRTPTSIIKKPGVNTTVDLLTSKTLEATAAFAFSVKWTPDQVVAVFQAAGLEVASPHPMTKEDYGEAPMMAIEGIHFLIPSLCETCGGRILSFANAADLKMTADFYSSIFTWFYIKDNILVQVNAGLPKETAMFYEGALNNLK